MKRPEALRRAEGRLLAFSGGAAYRALLEARCPHVTYRWHLGPGRPSAAADPAEEAAWRGLERACEAADAAALDGAQLEAAERVPGSAAFQVLLGRWAAGSEGMPLEEPRRRFERAAELDPALASAQACLGEILMAAGELEAAEASFARAVRLKPRWAAPRALLGELLRFRLQYPAALEATERALELEPEAGWLHAMAGRLYWRLGRREAAFRALDRAHALEPAQGWILAWRAEARAADRQAAGARADLDRAVELEPRYVRAWAWRGKLRQKAGDAAGAAADARRALELDPGYEPALRLAFEAAKASGDWTAALDHLDHLVRRYWAHAWAHDWMGEERLPAARLERALAELARAGSDPRVLAWKGEVLVEAGRWAEAVSCLEGARLGWALAWRAEARLGLGESEAALRDLAEAERLEPGYGRILAVRARVLLELGRPAQAAAELDRLLAAQPLHSFAWPLYWRALCAFRLGRSEEARPFLARALAKAPGLAAAKALERELGAGVLR